MYKMYFLFRSLAVAFYFQVPRNCPNICVVTLSEKRLRIVLGNEEGEDVGGTNSGSQILEYNCSITG